MEATTVGVTRRKPINIGGDKSGLQFSSHLLVDDLPDIEYIFYYFVFGTTFTDLALFARLLDEIGVEDFVKFFYWIYMY